MKKILLVMAVTVALSLNACTFTDQSETSNMVDAQKWYDKAGEEDQQEAAEEASTQSIEDAK